ncbi:MAG: hypothetical protein CL885_03495 [Dehalococcoidia bacterium]|nr:hypothetical protein [Dehalococcoidia bacterium]
MPGPFEKQPPSFSTDFSATVDNSSVIDNSSSQDVEEEGFSYDPAGATYNTVLTYPTPGIFVFDVPEPKDLDGKFYYNYFLKNEQVSMDSIGTKESYDRHGKRPARYVKLSFSPLYTFNNTLGIDPNSIQLTLEEKKRILRENYEKIDSELDYAGQNFVNISLQDNDATKQVQLAVEAGLRAQKVSTEKLSPLETVLKYNSTTSDKVSGQLILDNTDVEGTNEYTYIDPSTGAPFEVKQEGDVSSLAISCFLNKKFAADILKNSESAPFSPLFESLSQVMDETLEIQEDAIPNQKSYFVKAEDYEPVFDAIKTERVNIESTLTPGNQLMGYKIIKQEISPAGKVVYEKAIFVVNPFSSEYIDTEVKYGPTYRYSVSSIYLVKFYDFEQSALVSADVLVESRTSPFIDVVCQESKPPEPPNNLRFWMGQDRKFNIIWDFPFNPQEDIKYFQVYRRKTVDDPFTLLAEIDFDDSDLKSIKSEVIPEYAQLKVKKPQSYYIDGDFELDTEYIYAVCCVDAHDLSSPYSEQFKVNWDRTLAQLLVELVCYSGSPKPYPNFNLKANLTSDAIRDSRHHKLTVYFDPEYLKITNSAGEDLGHLKTNSEMPSYKIQIINLDRQASQTLKINVVDLT